MRMEAKVEDPTTHRPEGPDDTDTAHARSSQRRFSLDQPSGSADDVHSTQLALLFRPLFQSDAWVGVPLAALAVAVRVYKQDEHWSCGPHATLRALLMTNRILLSEDAVAMHIGRCPKTLPRWSALRFMVDTSIGPLPSVLASYAGAQHVYFRWASGEHVREVVERVRARVLDGAPCVVLVSQGGLLLHYLLVVRWNLQRNCAGILDVNHSVQTWSYPRLCRKMGTFLGVHALLF